MAPTLDSLVHTTKTLPSGGTVLVLHTGALIGPEAEAMLQALHSRSTGGIANHLAVLKDKGPDRFMNTFYVGYGHRSIGDCGDATVFVEGVSMLAAKAIQDWRLYSGQESSTRYVDFAAQPFLDPQHAPAGRAIQEAWRAFYLKGIAALDPVLRTRHPLRDGEDERIYRKAIAARGFDIMRSFLPAGAATNLAWHMNLRQFADELALLRHHPLEEVRQIALTTESALLTAFPNSFTTKRYDATEAYHAALMGSYYYDNDRATDFKLAHDGIDRTLLATYRAALANRPARTELPRQIAECGTVRFTFLLDFGSFRDIQRHRAVVQRMPLLSTRHGFHPWYLAQLPEDLRREADTLLAAQERAIAALHIPPETAQYYVAMGYRTTNRLTGDLHALAYLVELRSTQFVHPTLRARARQMATALMDAFGPEGLILHADDEPDRFDVRRGEHDIVQLS